MPATIKASPSSREGAGRSRDTSQPPSAVNTGRLPATKMPMCAAGAHCAPASTTSPNGRPPHSTSSAQRLYDRPAGHPLRRNHSGASTRAGTA